MTGIQTVRQSEWIENIERKTRYEWSDIEYWVITPDPEGYNSQDGLDLLLSLNVRFEEGRRLWVRVGDVFED